MQTVQENNNSLNDRTQTVDTKSEKEEEEKEEEEEEEEDVELSTLKMPSMKRLKSSLSSPKSLNGKLGYNTIDDLTKMTGKTIENKLKSSVDIILYDHDDDDDDDDDDDIHITDDDDDDDDQQQTSRNYENKKKKNKRNVIKCNCCLWLNKYKISIIFTILLCVVTYLIPHFVNEETISIEALYIEFFLFLLTLLFICRNLWKLFSYLLFICTMRRWCRHKWFNLEKFIFYIHHSGTYISLSLLTTVSYLVFIYFSYKSNKNNRFHRIIENINNKLLQFIIRLLLCSMIFFYGLFIKTILIRWICLKYYLANSLLKIKKMRKYESWIKILLKNKNIFSIKVKEFLDINEIHNKYHQDSNLNNFNENIIFRLNALAFQDEYNLSTQSKRQQEEEEEEEEEEEMKLVNTLTSGTMFNCSSQKEYAHNVNTCLLWLYNSNTNKVTIIDDNELDKLCKQFTKYIVLSVTKNRFNKTPNNNNNNNIKPTFIELKTIFSNNNKSTINSGGGGGGIRNKLIRSSLSVGGDYITQDEFIYCFTKLNKTKQGYEAWKEINISDKQLTKKELHRWLYQYLHNLIYLKQTLGSYQEILLNLDISGNVIAILLLFFIFLLIFEFDFQDSISIYFSMIAIFAVFGHNVFTQWFDAVYFIFILQPYEIGDVVLIDNIRYTINKIYIMSTEMTTSVNNGNIIIIKNNAFLLGKDIKNLSKTKTPYHNISFFISQLTSINQLNLLKFKIEKFIKKQMNNDINDVWFILDGVDKECRMKISLFLGSIYSFSDSKTQWKQYHLINIQIRKIINEMGIQYKRFSHQDIQLSSHFDH